MAGPKSFRQKVRKETRKAINRALEQDRVTEAEIETAAADFDLSEYNAFFADCREAGKTTERCGALWNNLKERGLAPEGGTSGGSAGSGGGSTPASGARSAPGGSTAGAAPTADLDGLDAQLRNADAAYLVVTGGCPSCAQAEEVLSEFIDDGTIEPIDPAESDLGADIVLETELDQVPTLVIQDDGQFREI